MCEDHVRHVLIAIHREGSSALFRSKLPSRKIRDGTSVTARRVNLLRQDSTFDLIRVRAFGLSPCLAEFSALGLTENGSRASRVVFGDVDTLRTLQRSTPRAG